MKKHTLFFLIGTSSLLSTTPVMSSLCSIDCYPQLRFCRNKNCDTLTLLSEERRQKCVKDNCEYVWKDCLKKYGCDDTEPIPGGLIEPLKPPAGEKPPPPAEELSPEEECQLNEGSLSEDEPQLDEDCLLEKERQLDAELLSDEESLPSE